ncbi:ArsC family transcriptional regulator [Eggerthella lenta]|nr:ArsC family transcriptional regulator [Eggerthella lenta]MDB1769074.1 ArsC family transcriptional regulator [Eggerthella lenta]
MNIQVFGTKKSFDTKKAQRYFKERRVKFQFIDLKEKGMSKGELESVARAVGGIDVLVDPKAKDADTVSLLAYLSPDQKFDKLLENQHVLAEPVVRNGKQATVGYAPDVWKTWERSAMRLRASGCRRANALLTGRADRFLHGIRARSGGIV